MFESYRLLKGEINLNELPNDVNKNLYPCF